MRAAAALNVRAKNVSAASRRTFSITSCTAAPSDSEPPKRLAGLWSSKASLPAGADKEESSPDVEAYWKHCMHTCTKSALQELKANLIMNHPLGVKKSKTSTTGKTSTIPNYVFQLQQANAFPKFVLLVKNGAFYDCVGFSALAAMQVCDLKPTYEAFGVARAGVPLSTLANAVSRLNAAGFNVAVFKEVSSAPNAVGDSFISRELQHISTPAKPAYITGKDSSDSSDMAFQMQQPVIGIALGKAGFNVYELHVDKKHIVEMQQQTWEAVVSRLHAGGFAPTLYLHSSVKPQVKNLQPYIKRFSMSAVATSMMFDDPDPMTGFKNMVKKEIYCSQLPQDVELEVVAMPQPEVDARPFPLPMSTVTQLGLTGSIGVPNLIESVVSSGLAPQAKAFIRKLLLLPPSPSEALHIQGAVKHLAHTKQAMKQLKCDMPGPKISEVLQKGVGDAPFFRALAEMIKPMEAMLGQPAHAELWQHVVPFACSGEQWKGEVPNATVLRQHLLQCLVEVDGSVNLHPPTSLFGTDVDNSSPAQLKMQVIRNLPTGVLASLDDTVNESRLELATFFSACEAFRSRVNDARLADQMQKIQVLRGSVETLLLELYHWLLQRNMKSAAKLKQGRPRLQYNKESQRVWATFTGVGGGAKLGQERTKALNGFYDLSLSVDRNGDLVPGSFTTKGLTKAMVEYVDACNAAQDEADLVLSRLCTSLCVSLPELGLASRASVITTALDDHIRVAHRNGWAVPSLAPVPPQAADSKPAAGQGAQPRAQGPGFLKLKQFWPYWLSDNVAVRNDLTVDRMMLLTGANMAGKSTVLRSVAAVTLLALCGLLVPASEAYVPWFNSVVLRNFSGDSPEEGKSSFGLELDDIRAILAQCGPRSLLLLDELGKGTEVDAGTAFCAALLTRMCARGVPGIFATHLHKVVIFTNALETTGQLGYKCMGITCDEKKEKKGLRKGSWHIEDGTCFESLAFDVALDAGVDSEFVDDAQEKFQHLRRLDRAWQGHAAVPGPDETEIRWQPTNAPLEQESVSKEDHARPPGAHIEKAEKPKGPGMQDAIAILKHQATVLLQRALGDSYNDSATKNAAGAKEDHGDGCPQPWHVAVVEPDEQPPPTYGSVAAVYVIQYASGFFYAGKTTDVWDRLQEHREKLRKHRHKGPGARMAFVQLPGDSGTGAQAELETLVIKALKTAEFPMTSTRDGNTKRRIQTPLSLQD